MELISFWLIYWNFYFIELTKRNEASTASSS